MAVKYPDGPLKDAAMAARRQQDKGHGGAAPPAVAAWLARERALAAAALLPAALRMAVLLRPQSLLDQTTPSANNFDTGAGHVSTVSAFASPQRLIEAADMRLPHQWYPVARLIRRKIIYHGGPTNSGKTYQALQRLREADPAAGGGLFCGPLRLLALEVCEQLNSEGVYCSLLTGQELRIVPFASCVSCTIEMVNVDQDYDVAVIDEIQMLGNDYRGAAWTRALLGVRAREVHVCGGLEALDLVRALCSATGDELEVRRYDRKSPLLTARQALMPHGGYAAVQPGDCVVAFSRADLFAVRREIEETTPYKCGVVYGQLPPETRARQAKLFNDGTAGDGEDGYDVLVASDAIGMGLNLNIRRVIFHTVLKRKGLGSRVQRIEPTLLKQIGGRAGRLGSRWTDDGHNGEVTCLHEEDLPYVRSVMAAPLPAVEAAGVFPAIEHLQEFVEGLKALDLGGARSNPEGLRLASVLSGFLDLTAIEGDYFLCNHDHLEAAVAEVDHLPGLSLAEKFEYCLAPVSNRDATAMGMLGHFARCHAAGRPCSISMRLPDTHDVPRNVSELKALCTMHNVVDLYLWLAHRFPSTFLERELALQQKRHLIGIIDAALAGGARGLYHEYRHSDGDRELRRMLSAIEERNGKGSRGGDGGGGYGGRSSSGSARRQEGGGAGGSSSGGDFRSHSPSHTKATPRPETDATSGNGSVRKALKDLIGGSSSGGSSSSGGLSEPRSASRRRPAAGAAKPVKEKSKGGSGSGTAPAASGGARADCGSSASSTKTVKPCKRGSRMALTGAARRKVKAAK